MSKRTSQQLSTSTPTSTSQSNGPKVVSFTTSQHTQQATIVDMPLPPQPTQPTEKQMFLQQLEQRRKEFNDQLTQEMDTFVELDLENRLLARLQPKFQFFQQKIIELQMQNHLMATKLAFLEQTLASRPPAVPQQVSLPDMTLEQYITMQRNRASSVPPPLPGFPPTLQLLANGLPGLGGPPSNVKLENGASNSTSGQNGNVSDKQHK